VLGVWAAHAAALFPPVFGPLAKNANRLSNALAYS